MAKKTSLRKRMIFYFILIAFANVFVAGEIIFEITSNSYRTQVYKNIDNPDQASRIEVIDTMLNDLVKKYIVLVSILILVSSVILFLFVVQIVSPLNYMINVADKMSDGDLSLRVKIRSNDELSDLGNLINDLSNNIQEIIAQVERLSFDMTKLCELHSKNIRRHSKLPGVFKKETDTMDTLSQNLLFLKNSYILYAIDSFKRNYMYKDN
ncbi:MAG: methyl-accepting chemotaxis protein [Spirochaetes bacterium]|jgi:methyl-accepting chemotaxis protein|nr:methyl-accepting chemotaxis protein [Spirochaetota bacterium]